jgi:hypothetical protein
MATHEDMVRLRLQLEASIETDPDWKLARIVRSAPDELRRDKGLMVKAVSKYGEIFEQLPATLRGDEEVARVAIDAKFSFHRTLRFVSPELQTNKTFVNDVVQKWGRSLQWASKELRDDDEVVISAVKQDSYALSWASQRLLEDQEVVLEAVKQDPQSLRWASQELRKDKEFVKEFVIAAMKSRRGLNIQDFPFIFEKWFSDRDVVNLVVAQDGSKLQYACTKLKADRDLVLTAVQRTPTALQWASRELKMDRQLVLLAALRSKPVLSCAAPEIRAWATKVVGLIPPELRAQAPHMLARHDFPAPWFQSTMIYAIQGTFNHNSTLKIISQDHVTNTAIMKIIAKFAGVRCPEIMEANIVGSCD